MMDSSDKEVNEKNVRFQTSSRYKLSSDSIRKSKYPGPFTLLRILLDCAEKDLCRNTKGLTSTMMVLVCLLASPTLYFDFYSLKTLASDEMFMGSKLRL